MRWIITGVGAAIILGLAAFAAYDVTPKKPKIEGEDKPKEKRREGKWA